MSAILDLISEDDFLISEIKPSEWAEKHRIMSTEVSNFPGPYSYDKTPYLREIVDRLIKSDPAREVAVMKGAQIGFSCGVIENGIGWIISQSPGNILLAAMNLEMVKKMMEKNINQMIDSCGIRPLIRSNSQKKRNQSTGDTALTKEFAGGSLGAYSIQKPSTFRQVAMKYGFPDDFEAAPIDKKAGDAASLVRTRFKSFGKSKKIFWISTPEVSQTSNIFPLYLKGDQRKYNVPCPCCGDFIPLEWSITGTNGKPAGIVYNTDEDGDLIEGSVKYKCQSCAGTFNESHKYKMNLAGFWKPTVKQKDSGFFSYHISTLYAPPGMDGWDDVVKEYLSACPKDGKIDIPKYKTFWNTVLGLPWEQRGKAPKASKLSLNTRDYEMGVVPNAQSIEDGNGRIVMITCTADLGGTNEDARIDYELVAWSVSGCSYSIDHGSLGTFIPRENTLKKKEDRQKWNYVHFSDKNVWDPLMEIIKGIYPSDDGGEYQVSVSGIDTGHFTQFAYEFVDRANANGCRCYSLKGDKPDEFKKVSAMNRIYKKSTNRAGLYLLDVNTIKDELAALVDYNWVEGDNLNQPNGFMNFPAPSEGKYTMKSFFSHFEGEHKVMEKGKNGLDVGFLWTKKNSNVMNHFWDTRIYNMAIKEIMADEICKEAGVKDPSWMLYCAIMTG